MMEILGVDFSGAKSDRNTWLARGDMQDAKLTLNACRPVTRAELTELLLGLAAPAVVALDFPFSVPEIFARYWSPEAMTMPDLWAAAAGMELGEFIALRDSFVAQWGEPKRRGDTLYPECYSCLHKANPNLVPMTFHGMRLLHRLGSQQFHVPPLAAAPDQAPVVLLEIMPGAALRSFGLPYKGYKNGARVGPLRQRILDGIEELTCPTVTNLRDYRELAQYNHDCLDSVVAAVAAALWALDPGAFRVPAPPGAPGFDPVPLLEGWLYAPSLLLAGC